MTTQQDIERKMMVINPLLNAAQNIYAASGTGGSTTSTYYDVSVATPLKGRMFSTPIAENNPYRTEDVTHEMLTKLGLYTNMMLAGDMKTITEDYLHAMQVAIYVLNRAKTRTTDKLIEDTWAKATTMEGNVVENYTRELLYVLGIKR